VRPTDLRGMLQYVPQFREKTFVVAVDGAAVADENFVNILMDVAVLWSLSIRTVLVHGASDQIKALADQRGLAPSDLEGSGVTDAATLKLALTAANRLGILKGVDHLFTGKVDRIDVGLLQTLLSSGIVPVVPPLGVDGEGHTYRLNSDAVAVELAKALSAVKLIYITTTDGLSVGGVLARQLSVAELGEALQKGTGIPRVHVINGHVDEGLLSEVFSNEGIGTLVYVNDYRQIRRARRSDVRAIDQLIRSSIEKDELAPRTRASIEKELEDYYIFEVDKNPIACVALHPYPAENKGELACLYVRPSHENQGIGRTLVQFVESKARELGLGQLLALSTQAFNYFQAKGGFVEGTPDDLPPARRAKYDASGRRSKVLLKKLASPPA
jgi:amino-acid N-acetyltransferase